MKFDSFESLPVRVDVVEVLSSRYQTRGHERPLSWDERCEGLDVVLTADGLTLPLHSDGQQSVPKRGWGLMIVSGDSSEGYRWTLYSLPQGAGIASGPRI
jgi:hypothetical protein